MLMFVENVDYPEDTKERRPLIRRMMISRLRIMVLKLDVKVTELAGLGCNVFVA